jgi:hypothetical protein
MSAEQDRHFGPDRRNTLMAALTRLSTPEAPEGMSGEHAGTSGYDYMVQVFSGVMHGFALRGDMSVERNRWAKEASAKACRDWYVRSFAQFFPPIVTAVPLGSTGS